MTFIYHWILCLISTALKGPMYPFHLMLAQLSGRVPESRAALWALLPL